MSRGRLLLIEDDAALRDLVKQELSLVGYETDVAATGGEGLALALDGGYDLVILDLNLPDVDGLEVSRRLWDDGEIDADILMLTARGDVANRVAGLYAGASDYVTKPFDVRELVARVHVRMRERAGAGDELRNGDLVLDVAASTARRGDRSVVLPERECEILRLLLAHPGKLFSRDDLERRLYGPDVPASNTVEVFVYGLRRKLDGIGAHGLIRTVRHKGYMIT
jgi:DNA-binding response OmpR family regulator